MVGTSRLPVQLPAGVSVRHFPEAAIISVGDNSYGHPTDAAISRLKGLARQ